MTLRASAIKTDVLEQYKEEEQNQANVTTKTTTLNNISWYENKVEPNPATVTSTNTSTGTNTSTSTNTSTGTNSFNNISWDHWIVIIVVGGGGIIAILFLLAAFIIYGFNPFKYLYNLLSRSKNKTNGANVATITDASTTPPPARPPRPSIGQ